MWHLQLFLDNEEKKTMQNKGKEYSMYGEKELKMLEGQR